MDELHTWSDKSYHKVCQGIPGGGRLVSMYIITTMGVPGEDGHHSTVERYVGDINVLGNLKMPTTDTRDSVRDPELSNWSDLPKDVQEKFHEKLPSGTKVMDKDGEHIIR